MGLSIEIQPAEVGLDETRLGRLAGFLADRVSAGAIPGWSLAIGRRGALAHVSSWGHRDLERSLPIQDDTLFRIYSMTKPVTAVAAMMLHERGEFQLDDPVSAYIPSFEQVRVFDRLLPDGDLVTVPADRPVTIRHLLTHTAGLTYGFHHSHPVDSMYRDAGHELEAPSGLSLADACDVWAGLPLLFQPGSEWNYSVGTDVLGRVVEVMTGQCLGAFLHQEVFEPLGMSDTAFRVQESDRGRLAALYVADPTAGLVRNDTIGGAVLRADRAHFGGGGLVSTTHDYYRFATMLANGGVLDSERLLSPRTVDLMTANHLPGGADLEQFGRPMKTESPTAGVGQGLGVSVVLDPIRSRVPSGVGEFGWGGAASTVFWVDPELEMVVVFMTQVLPSVALPIRGLLHQLVGQAVIA